MRDAPQRALRAAQGIKRLEREFKVFVPNNPVNLQ
jgi:hypothetical protein